MFNKISAVILAAIMVMSGFSGDLMAQNKLESWYTYWGVGYADPQYPDDVDDFLQILEDFPGVNHATVGLDLLGFYWPANPKTAVGFVLNASGDRYELDGDYFQINGYTLGLSVMHFPTHTIGKGLFVRAEVGPARYVFDDNGDDTETTDWGFGGLVGAGFGFNVAPGTRILLNLNYAVRKVEEETTSTLGITIGGLF